MRNNSIRLRLTQSEVARFEESGYIEEVIEFGTGPGGRLTYCLATDTGTGIRSEFVDGRVKISVPLDDARRWAASAEVGLQAEQEIDGGKTLRILVEKDFACTTPREGEDDSDAFPFPSATSPAE